MKNLVSSAANSVFLATEPIQNQHVRILGYQIRVGDALGQDGAVSPDGDDAARLAASVGIAGISLLRRGQAAFVRVTRDGLLNDAPAALDPSHTIVEVPAAIGADRKVVAACAALHERRYQLSIDGFSTDTPVPELMPYASYVKIAANGVEGRSQRSRTVAMLKPGVRAVIATSVHTAEQMESAAAEGFEYFQGFVVGVPRTASGRDFSPNQVALLELLRALGDPNLSIHHLEDLVKHDPAICYRLLQTVNSAAFAVRSTVTSIAQAILLLGRDPIRRWASLWAMAGLGADSHDELVVMSAVRARLCETLVTAARGQEAGSEAFLLGMCSMFDAILGRPMAEVVTELPFEESSRQVLCGRPGPLRGVLDSVIAHERGAFRDSAAIAAGAGLNARLLPGAFMEALRWTRELHDIRFQIAVSH